MIPETLAVLQTGLLVIVAASSAVPVALVCFALGMAIGYEFERRRARRGAPRPWSHRSAGS